MNINSVTFKANYVTQWQVLVKPTNKNDKPEYVSASFVELDPENENDLDTMYNLNLHWGFLETYAYQILDSMERIHKNLMRYNENSKFYALTLQHDKFEKLEPKKILAVTELTEDKDKNSISINYLQVDPNNVRNAI